MKHICMLATVAATLTVCGTDFYIKDGARDWTSGDSYEGGIAPTAQTDRPQVYVRAGRTVYLDATDTASYGLLNGSVERIFPIAPTSRIVVDVPESGDVRTLTCFVSSSSGGTAGSSPKNGVVVKTGAGRLVVDGGTDNYAHMVGFEIREGDVELTCAVDGKPNYGAIAVSNNATLHLPDCCSYCSILGLWGEGLVTADEKVQTRVGSVAGFRLRSRFGGVLDKNVFWFSPGGCDLVGTSSVMTTECTAFDGHEYFGEDYMTGVMKFGNQSDTASSIGVRYYLQTADWGGGFRYLGTGETTDKALYLSGYKEAYSTLDGGPNGNLVWKGTVGVQSTKSEWMSRFRLSGENVLAPCVFADTCNLSDLTWINPNTSKRQAFHFLKTGTGAWHFKDSTNNGLRRCFTGGFEIREGAILFDSLVNRRQPCSLGLATDLNDGTYAGPHDPAHDVDYAFSFGMTNAQGVAASEGELRYVGAGTATSGVWCEDRRAILVGNGRFDNDTAESFRFKGVRSRGAAAKTLTLDGSSAAENAIADVTDDGAGAISLVKEGTGTWTLTGTNSFHGALSVKSGTLVVANRARDPFTWFRWTVREVSAGDNYTLCCAQEFALYDAEGRRQNKLLRPCANYTALAPSEAAYGCRLNFNENVGMSSINPEGPWHGLARLFDAYLNYKPESGVKPYWEKDAGDYRNGWFVRVRNFKGDDNCSVSPSDPATWVPVVMRLDVSAAEIDSYDIVRSRQGGGNPESFLLEGSPDGLSWTVLDDVTASGLTTATAFTWLYGKDNAGDGDVVRKDKGRKIAGRNATAVWPMLNNCSTVSVAKGATLKAVGDVTIPNLKVDATAGNGTVDGFAFAASGTINVTNVPDGVRDVSIACDFRNCADVENMANWNLKVNGESSGSWQHSVQGNTIHLFKKGLVIQLR